jgi:hypothetical protein
LQCHQNDIDFAAHRWPRVLVFSLLELPFRFLRLSLKPIPLLFDTGQLFAKITVLLRPTAGFALPARSALPQFRL